MENNPRQTDFVTRQEASCNLKHETLQPLSFYALVENGEGSDDGTRSRRRSLRTTSTRKYENYVIFTTNATSVSGVSENVDRNNVLYGRKCVCAPDDNVYCPASVPLCKVSAGDSLSSLRIQCLDDSQGQAMNVLIPLVILLFLWVACLWVCTNRGKYARGFLRKVAFCWNEEQYEQALGEDIDHMVQRARQRRILAQRHHRNPNRVYYNRRHASLNLMSALSSQPRESARREEHQEDLPTHIAVALRTRLYDCNNDKNQDCMICLAELTSNDRVGDLPCGHAFHVEPCLKEWIMRKNHCPLCQGSNLASPIDLANFRKDTTLTTNESSQTDGGNAPVDN